MGRSKNLLFLSQHHKGGIIVTNGRSNADLYFLNYKKQPRIKYLFPFIFSLLILGAGLLFLFNQLPWKIENLYSYIIIGVGGLFFLFSVIGFFAGKDKVKIPTDGEMAGLLAEDIANVKTTMVTQLSPDFSGQNIKEFLVINHCSDSIYGFTPYFKKTQDNRLICSLNKITIFTFSQKRLQIFTSIVDICTGIEIMQNCIKVPYSDITNSYIAYSTFIKEGTVRFGESEKKGKNVLPPKFISAAKSCKEVLRIKTRNMDEKECINYDIMVADYEIFYTKTGIFKNVLTLNDGKSIEREILKRTGVAEIIDEKDYAERNVNNKITDFNFIDDIHLTGLVPPSITT